MCFSAQASFLAGTGLSLFGIHILKSPHKKKDRYFLAIPLMFGIQQLSEGMVWVSNTNSAYAQYNTFASYLFLFFAFFAWPIWVPFSLEKMETNSNIKKRLFGLFMAGIVVSTTIAWMALNLGVAPTISCNHIEYLINWPEVFIFPGITWYAITTIAPFFIIRKKTFNLFGILLFFSIIISGAFYINWFISVWCFFAALLSFLIYKIK